MRYNLQLSSLSLFDSGSKEVGVEAPSAAERMNRVGKGGRNGCTHTLCDERQLLHTAAGIVARIACCTVHVRSIIISRKVQ